MQELKTCLIEQLRILKKKNDFYTGTRNDVLNSINTMNTSFSNIRILGNLKNLSKKEKAITEAAIFLWEFEGMYIGLLDLVSVLLIRNGT